MRGGGGVCGHCGEEGYASKVKRKRKVCDAKTSSGNTDILDSYPLANPKIKVYEFRTTTDKLLLYPITYIHNRTKRRKLYYQISKLSLVWFLVGICLYSKNKKKLIF